MRDIEMKLNIARKELLDLSFRNPLLNFKLRKTSGLQFFDVKLFDIYDYLVLEEKGIQFTREATNKPNRLSVICDEGELRTRLNLIFRNSRMFLEEKGANILFLALGFLKWETEGIFYKSPLVLVPVNLKRAENSDRYTLLFSNEDVKLNVTLAMKLRQDFGIDIEHEFNDFDLNRYLHFIKEKIYTKRNWGWEVLDTEAALDFFSYGKYLMYQDLDVNKWVKNGKPLNNKVIDGLLMSGFNADEIMVSKSSDGEKIPLYNVVDADSSQAQSIREVNQGKNLVLQGPPGTGKSQTICNIIANSVALGKTVLFVAEKKAALDVVNRRLKSVGLDDIAFELHSHKSNRRDVLKTLEYTISLGAPKIDMDNDINQKCNDIGERLNEYKDIVNRPVGNSHLTPLNVYGELLQMKNDLEAANIRLPRMEFKNIAKLTDEEFMLAEENVKEFVSVLDKIGNAEKHPFYGVGLTSCLPYEQVAIKERIENLDDAINMLIKANNDLCQATDTRANNIFESIRISNSIVGVSNIAISGINSQSYLYREQSEVLYEIISYGKKAQSFLNKNGAFIKSDALNDDNFLSLYQAYSDAGFFLRKKIKHQLKSYLDFNANQQLLSEINDFLLIKEYLSEHNQIIREAFASEYQGIEKTDWDQLSKYTDIAVDIHKKIACYQYIPSVKNILDDIEKRDKFCELQECFQQAYQTFCTSLSRYMLAVDFDVINRFGYQKWYYDVSYTDIKKIIIGWKDNYSRISEMVDYNIAKQKMISVDLQDLIDLSSVWKNNYSYLIDILRNERLTGLLDLAFSESTVLQEFKKYDHERQVELFKELDIKTMVENIKYILLRHHEQKPGINDVSPEMNILRREFQKKKNQMPIRNLLAKAKTAIQRIKPVFMMSPLSIASYLEPGEMTFDVVIFDEASQVRPVEAFGALLRAKQIVVVGDSNQLPPTNFFDSMANKYDELTDEDYDIANMESILSLLLARNIKERTLNWHYRSRHKSLIMISNREFYDEKLHIFPSVNDPDLHEGLIFRLLKDTAYLRGKTRTNPKEAKAVVKAVLEHAINHPESSLGVVSFSMAQMEEIYREFERVMKNNQNPLIDDFFRQHETEPFFIKNLENVQGDERDVIFISIGYGFDEMHNLTMDFGPLNRDGGERRLNVLITRARIRTEVFSNITGYDINLTKTNSLGVKALKSYLDYAQNRENYDNYGHNEKLCSFLEYLRNRLIDYGYQVDRNVGVQGLGIDLAIVDPQNHQRYLLGIECDGGSYANFACATDRERLRSMVFSNLGWKIYHIWTTDFYRNPKVEFERLLNYIAGLQNGTALIEKKPSNPIIEIKRGKALNTEFSDNSFEYKLYNGPKRRSAIIDEIETLKFLIIKIIHAEAPIYEKEIYRRIADTIQAKKVSEKMKNKIANALSCIDDGDIYYEQGFYYILAAPIVARNRSKMPLALRRLEAISDKELKAGVYAAIDSGEATTTDEVIRCLAEILGISRSTGLAEKGKELLLDMINKKIMYVDNGIIYINDLKEKSI